MEDIAFHFPLINVDRHAIATKARPCLEFFINSAQKPLRLMEEILHQLVW